MLAHSIISTHLFPTVSIYQIFTETYAMLCYVYRDMRLALQSLFFAILRCKVTHFFEVINLQFLRQD